MRIGSAFSGIGCFEYGVQQVLPTSSVQWQIEIEEWPRRVLAKHWPDADRSVAGWLAVHRYQQSRQDGGIRWREIWTLV